MKQPVIVTSRQKWTDDQKRQLVAESYKAQVSLNQLCKTYGVPPSNLCKWRKQFKELQMSQEMKMIEDQSQGPTLVHDELLALKNENSDLKIECQGLIQRVGELQQYIGRKLFELECNNV